MTPKPETFKMMQVDDRKFDNVVISGISGLYPQSSNIKDFSNILYNKINPVTSDDCRWKFKHPEMTDYNGKIPIMDRFDGQFFKVHYRQGCAMDPMSRKILEQSYQAIYDAGINPSSLMDKKVGVFVSTTILENEASGLLDTSSKTGLWITGYSKTMFANRISYWLGAKGPSVTYDANCSGSFEAINQAYAAIKSGQCESAIVGGVNLCILPQSSINAKRCFALAPDGKTKSFDESADGTARSDSISVLFLQKASNALRIYGEVVYVKTEFVSQLSCATGQVFGFIRDPNNTAAFLKQFYEEVQISPQAVEYIEAFGSATPAADKAELQAIEKVFCENKIDTLYVGSVISNIGLTDAAAGAVAVTKVMLGYHTGRIASNLHCDSPRKDVAGLREGRMQILREHQNTGYGYIGVNGLSVTGLNSHALLKGHFKPKDLTRYRTSFPHLVTITTRQERFIGSVFEDLKSRPIDPEELALFHNIHSAPVAGHLGKGYIILDTDGANSTKCLHEAAEFKDDMQRPLWFAYSGMGSQWTEMGTQLLRIPIFAAAIERCDKVLKPHGIDIFDIITTKDEAIFENVLYSFVGIAAIQIGLTDILTAIGLKPDKLIGHSVGELGCAYADGCLTAEEMILSAYARGRASNEGVKTRGAMAAIGLGYNQIVDHCPPEIDVACHNSSESSTISGPAKIVKEYVAKLVAAGVFAKEVASSNIAYHSRYIAEAENSLRFYMSKIIKTPKLRSERWLSTSVPQEKWDEESSKYCSPDYLINNLLGSVLFEETSQLIPSNAVVVEIAPHGLLQGILKRSLPSCTNITLTLRGHQDNAVFLLNAIGKIFLEGFYLDLQALYPKVEFPVSTGTPHLSHHVKWMHAQPWPTYTHMKHFAKKSSCCKFRITIHDDEHNYLRGNIIQGKIQYPFAGALVAVWDTLSMTLKPKYKKRVAVHFREVHLFSQPIMHEQRQVELDVTLHRINGEFEVLDGKSRVARGFISTESYVKKTLINNDISGPFHISSNEVYQQLSAQGYSYKNEFRSIYAVNKELTKAQIVWGDNWVTLIDGLLQFNMLKHNLTGVTKPTYIRDLKIDVKKHMSCLREISTDLAVVNAEVDDVFESTRCGGITMQNIQFSNEALKIPSELTFELYASPLCSTHSRGTNYSQQKESAVIKRGTLNTGTALALNLENVINFDDLKWEDVAEYSKSAIDVNFASVTTHDVKMITGVIKTHNNDFGYGRDFSGLTCNGDRVMGLVRSKSISTVVETLPELIWSFPNHWSLEDAATVPLAYAQAFYCMCIKYDLQGSDKVLIHGGAGALGQAAISIALAFGCTVFTTVSDLSKKSFLMKMFPKLREEYISCSRKCSFADMILNATHGNGCEFILNCVKGHLKNVCLKCVAFSGVVIDTAQIEHNDKFIYGMSNMTRARSYKTVDFNCIFDSKNIYDFKKIQQYMVEGISGGWVRPLSRVTFPSHEAPRAFRLLAANKQRGRVLIQLKDTVKLSSTPRISYSTDCSHIVLWDGEVFGLQFVERLISRGATKILIFCVNSITNYQLKLSSWKGQGIDVQIAFDKAINFKNIARMMTKAQRMGPVEGIYITSNNKFVKDISSVLCSEKSVADLCPALKYSAIIVVYNDENRNNNSFIKNRFPLTVISLPDLKQVNWQLGASINESTWMNAALNVTEQAIFSGLHIVNARPHLADQPSVMQQIIGLLDEERAKLFADTNISLEELKVEPVLVDAIGTCLENILHISLIDDDILNLNRNSILQMELSTRYKDVEIERGLKMFFSYVDIDELRSTADVMVMDTLVTDTATMGQELDVESTYLCIIPGVEGHHERFRSLCQRLKLPTMVLQPGLDYLDESIQQLALRYSKILLNKLGLKDRFILLGYEYGVEVALELASILETNGLVGTVICIGDDPEIMRRQIDEILQEYPTEDELKFGVALHMFTLMAEGVELEHAPLENYSWDQKIDIMRNELNCVSRTAQYIRGIIKAAYSRIINFRNHRPVPRTLKSKIILLRTCNETPSSNFEKYSSPKLVVYDLFIPLSFALKDLRCASIINRHLPDDVLGLFDMTNLCTSYIVDDNIMKLENQDE